jgi:hypothetical protein
MIKGKKDGVMMIKPGRLMVGNTVMVGGVVLHVVPNIRPGLCLENT